MSAQAIRFDRPSPASRRGFSFSESYKSVGLDALSDDRHCGDTLIGAGLTPAPAERSY
jgi:hypothetical protein